jgi:exosortase/archaeosortase family protein
LKESPSSIGRWFRRNYVLVRFYLLLGYCWLLLYFILHWKVSHEYIAVYVPILMAKSVVFVYHVFGVAATTTVRSTLAGTSLVPIAGFLGVDARTLTTVTNVYVNLPGFGFEIIYQCAGVFGMMIYASAVIAFPSKIREKLLGLVMGIVGLYVINTVRMSVLGMIGIYWSDLFHFFHEWMWQGIFIAFVIVFWLIWKEKIVRSEARPGVSG